MGVGVSPFPTCIAVLLRAYAMEQMPNSDVDVLTLLRYGDGAATCSSWILGMA